MHAGPEACAANPESCQIDRVSVMNEDGECPEHQCAEGYGGELCNSKYSTTTRTIPLSFLTQMSMNVRQTTRVMSMQTVMILMVATGVSVAQDFWEMDTTAQVSLCFDF